MTWGGWGRRQREWKKNGEGIGREGNVFPQ